MREEFYFSKLNLRSDCKNLAAPKYAEKNQMTEHTEITKQTGRARLFSNHFLFIPLFSFVPYLSPLTWQLTRQRHHLALNYL